MKLDRSVAEHGTTLLAQEYKKRINIQVRSLFEITSLKFNSIAAAYIIFIPFDPFKTKNI